MPAQSTDLVGRRVLARGQPGEVIQWEPLGSQCDALVRFRAEFGKVVIGRAINSAPADLDP